MSMVLLIAAFTVIVLYETPDIIRNKRWGELVVFTGLVLVGFVVSLLLTLGARVPNPVKAIEFVTGKIAGLFK